VASLRKIKGTRLWRVAWHITPAEGRNKGKAIRGSRTFKDRRAAREYKRWREQWADRVRAGMATGAAELDITIRDFLIDYRSERAPSTYDRVRRILQSFRIWTMMQDVLHLADLTPPVLKRYRRERAREVSRRTVNREVSAISSFLSWCVSAGELAENPATGIKALYVPQAEKGALPTRQEIAWVIHHIKRRYVRWQIVLLLSTGARISETVNATRAALDWPRRVWNILGKGNKGREAYLYGPAYFAMRYLEAFSQRKGSPYIACTQTGKQSSRRTMVRTLQKACRELGLRHFSPHTLRHCFGTWHAARGTPLPILQRLMGHAHIQTTIQNYFHHSPEYARQAVEALRAARAPTTPRR